MNSTSVKKIETMATTTTTTKKTSVDVDYNKHIKGLLQNHRQVPLKKEQLITMKKQYERLDHLGFSKMTTEEIATYHQLKKTITTLTQEIEGLETLSDVSEYYLKTGELLFNYYENDESHPKISSVEKKSNPSSVSQHSLNMKHPDTSISPDPPNPSNPPNPPNPPNPIGSSGPSSPPPISSTSASKLTPLLPLTTSIQRADLYEQYLSCTDPHYVGSPQYDKQDEFCQKCGVYRELNSSEALYVCPKCGDEIPIIMESDKPSYHDPPHENMYFAYKRINHYREQLTHFQAIETTKIPQDVYDIILVEFNKEKETNLADLTRTKVKKYLQKYAYLGYNKYYENINQIICHLNGIQLFYMPPEVVEQFCSMFTKIQEPFDRHCPPERKNFLSYSYVNYKFAQLCGYTEYLPYFNLLKSKDKLHEQDKIWKEICYDLGWKYYPSPSY